MRKITTGIVGCGRVGTFHAEAYASLKESRFIGVMDHDFQRAKTFAQQYHVHAFSSLVEMRQAGVEAVSICTPHLLHVKPAVEAADLGMHILVEKPLAITLAGCDRILAAAERTGITGGVVCQRRFYEPCMRMKRAIDKGKIGKPVLGVVNMLGWRSMEYYASDPWRGTWEGEGGGVLVNQAPHQLDLLLWYMGEIEELYGAWGTLNHPGLEVDDTAVAVIRFKNGGLGSLVVSNSQNPALYGKVHIHGENGASIGVQTDGGAMFIAGMSEITEPPYNDLWTVPGEEELLPGWQEEDRVAFQQINSMTYYHTVQIRDFLQAILEKRRPLVTLEDGRCTVELFDAIYRSQRTNQPVRFPLEGEL